jgi:mRNA interferase MazF
MTSKGFTAPFRVPINHAGTRGPIVLDQFRTVDKNRLIKRLGLMLRRTLGMTLATVPELFAE